MQTTIITITESPSMRNVFSQTHKKGNGKTFHGDAGHDPGAAAAVAMQLALSCGGAYLILGPKKVMEYIPTEMRSKS